MLRSNLTLFHSQTSVPRHWGTQSRCAFTHRYTPQKVTSFLWGNNTNFFFNNLWKRAVTLGLNKHVIKQKTEFTKGPVCQCCGSNSLLSSPRIKSWKRFLLGENSWLSPLAAQTQQLTPQGLNSVASKGTTPMSGGSHRMLILSELQDCRFSWCAPTSLQKEPLGVDHKLWAVLSEGYLPGPWWQVTTVLELSR